MRPGNEGYLFVDDKEVGKVTKVIQDGKVLYQGPTMALVYPLPTHVHFHGGPLHGTVSAIKSSNPKMMDLWRNIEALTFNPQRGYAGTRDIGPLEALDRASRRRICGKYVVGRESMNKDYRHFIWVPDDQDDDDE